MRQTEVRHLETLIFLRQPQAERGGKAVAAIENITIADNEQLSASCFKVEILDGLNGTEIEFIDPSTDGGEPGNNTVHLMIPRGILKRYPELIDNPGSCTRRIKFI
jgi:hypothetical protein